MKLPITIRVSSPWKMLFSFVLVLCLLLPVSGFARVDRSDALEGDPEDGLDAAGGGGSGGGGNEGESSSLDLIGDQIYPIAPHMFTGNPEIPAITLKIKGKTIYVIFLKGWQDFSRGEN